MKHNQQRKKTISTALNLGGNLGFRNPTSVSVIFKQILGLDDMFCLTAIKTIISFFIYEEWLLLSLKGKWRNPGIALSYFTNESNLRIQIYEKYRDLNTDYIVFKRS